MSSTRVGIGYVDIEPSFKGFAGKVDSTISSEMSGAGKKGAASFGKSIIPGVAGVGAAIVGAMGIGKAISGVVGFAKQSLSDLANVEVINAQTANVIKSTGNAANVSADEVEKLAGKLEVMTSTEAESIQEGANLLLTFKNIKNGVGEGNDIFNQATTSLVDMARAMGQEPKAAAIQLGKALNDPIKGVAALGRVGITFSEDQKKVIEKLVETGETATAQKMILEELNSQFGGSGEAYAKTLEGQQKALENNIGNVGETLFSKLQEPLAAIVGDVNKVLVSLVESGQLEIWAEKLGSILTGAWEIVKNIFAFFQGGAGDALGSLMELSPLATVFKIIGELLPVIMPLFKQLFETLLPLAMQLGESLKPVIDTVIELAGVVATALFPVIQGLAGLFGSAIMPLFKQLFDLIVPLAIDLAKNLVPVIAAVIELAGAVAEALFPIIQSLAGLFSTTLLPILGMILNMIVPIIKIILAVLIPVIKLLIPVVQFVANAVALAIYGLANIFVFIGNVIIDLLNTFGMGIPRMAAPAAPDIQGLYTGGTVKGSKEGSLVRVGDRHNEEKVVSGDGQNALIASTTALATQAMEQGGNNNNNGGLTIIVNQQPGESDEELTNRIAERAAFDRTASTEEYYYGN